jgi:hypothetical protein
MKTLALLLIFASSVLAFTPEQEVAIRNCYHADAADRGLDQVARINELLGFILMTKDAQKTTLTNMLNRCRERITTQQKKRAEDLATSDAAIDAQGKSMDAALSAIPEAK